MGWSCDGQALTIKDGGVFQHILRILGTNVDGKTKVLYAMTSCKGIGRRFSNIVCKKADVDMDKRAGELTQKEMYDLVNVVQNPNEYTGQLGRQHSCLWLNTDRCWLVNGAVFKADGNFMNHFFYRAIGDTPITVGSYPKTQSDYQRLRSHGITAVLNLMDKADLRQHQLDKAE